MFNDLMDTCLEYLQLGNVTKAMELLDKARGQALGMAERKLAHDMGNEIQKEIFAQYELMEGRAA